MISKAIENCLHQARIKSWPKTYWAFDIHGTILKPNYKRNEISREFYPHAKEVLQKLNIRKDIVRILYTCSYPHEIKQYLEYFAQHDIYFDYINENPEIADGGYGYYQDKFYFNVLMDDKAGFDGETDWKVIADLL
ncbi:MAG: hypothetical protein JSU09_00215 [Bacteroidetes bacterium]|nr:hypothetical protein [Bacteroidota bacterium]